MLNEMFCQFIAYYTKKEISPSNKCNGLYVICNSISYIILSIGKLKLRLYYTKIKIYSCNKDNGYQSKNNFISYIIMSILMRGITC